ncbi:predicted protein [Arabidopsis lyrata subsp. lyrata]|uniref:Predicted protein n=1 Tax=Arabidopsis lyrata subsp. lyrata TaxID=81972 RepID=D7MIT2_ARALL|nr:predicted protein [Arabidopsis lyrata subsp. lyrata]
MKSKKKDFGGGRDIISELPDELICHILSFLPTKEAASTSVLAKRWKPLLRYVPSLDFGNSLCFPPAKTYEEKRTNARSFMRFVDGVLALQGNARINRFHFKGEDIIDEMWVLDWIQNVVKRHVSDIRLYVSSFWDGFDSSFYPLPREIFVSQTLVTLIINFEGGVNISVEGAVSLPKLKTLHLHYFKIEMSTFNKLLSGCHALEELMLLNLVWDKSSEPEPCFATSLSIPTLKRLEYCRYERDDEAKDKVSLSFDSPNVVYLEYFDCVADRYQQVSFDSLVEARLGLRLTYDQGIHHIYSYRCEDEDGCLCRYPTDFGGGSSRSCLPIIKSGQGSKDIELWDQIEHVEHFIEKMPNLEQVILHYYTSNDEDLMMKVFKKLENLPRVASANCKIQLISDNLSLSSNASD